MIDLGNDGFIPLCELSQNESGTVRYIGLEGAIRARLCDLGLIEGTRVTALFEAFSGDPYAYLIRGAVIALRKGDSGKIMIEKHSSCCCE